MKYRLSILTAVAIIILSTIPVPEVKMLDNIHFFDKWVHFVMYGALTSAMYTDRYLIHRDSPSLTPPFILAAFILPSLLGGLMEIVQAYCTTCRSGEWLDFYADTFGALLATIISIAIWKIVKTSVLR